MPDDMMPIPQRNCAEMLEKLEKAGYGKPGTPNSLWAMVHAACDEVVELRVLVQLARDAIMTQDSDEYFRLKFALEEFDGIRENSA